MTSLLYAVTENREVLAGRHAICGNCDEIIAEIDALDARMQRQFSDRDRQQREYDNALSLQMSRQDAFSLRCMGDKS